MNGEKKQKPIEEVIPFAATCDGMFYVKIMEQSAKYWKTQKIKFSFANAEAVRRAAALIQALMTGELEIDPSSPPNRPLEEGKQGS